MSEATTAQPQDPGAPPRSSRCWWLVVLAAPLWLLWPCLFGARTFLPYDLAQFPPASLEHTPDDLQRLRAESNFDITEPPIWFVPELQRARRTLFEEHALPNWHPTARAGTALLPHGHDAMLYPPVWPALLASDPATMLGWTALLDLLIAGTLMFGFLRALRLQPAAAAFGALALCVSSTLCANAHNYSRLASLVWLPGMLWGLRAAADAAGAARRRALCGFAACFALSWYGGFPPFALPATGIGCAYALALALTAWQQDRRTGLRTGLEFAAAIGLGAMAAALYVLPAFAFFAESARPVAPDLVSISRVTFDPFGLLGYLVPDLFGRPDTVTSLPYDRNPLVLLLADRCAHGGAQLEPNYNATEYALFGGSLALWLAVTAVGHRRGRHPWFPFAMLLLYWALAAFVPPLRYAFLLPGVQVVPPLRFVGPCCVLVAWLAAQGLELALQRASVRRLAVGTGLAAATAALAFWFATAVQRPQAFADWHLAETIGERYGNLMAALRDPQVVDREILHASDGGSYVERGSVLAGTAAWSAAWFHAGAAVLAALLLLRHRLPLRGRHGVVAATLLLTAAELIGAGRTFDRGIAREGTDWTPVHDFLCAARRDAADRGGFMIARAAPFAPGDKAPLPQALPPGTLGPHDIRDLQVYTYFDKRSVEPLRALCEATGHLVDTSKGYVATCLPDDERVLQHPLLDLLGVRYVLSDVPLQHAGERQQPPDPRTGAPWRPPGGEFFVYERATALPRAFVVPRLEVAADDDAVVKAMADPAFRPREVAYVTRTELGDRALPATDPRAAQRAVHFRKDHATAIELEVDDGAAGLLLLADTWLPGWTATVDGADVPILRADHAMRAVAIPAGRSVVEFTYTAPRQALGFSLTLLALVALAAAAWRGRSSPKEKRAETPT